jgi:hypothetical protein
MVSYSKSHVSWLIDPAEVSAVGHACGLGEGFGLFSSSTPLGSDLNHNPGIGPRGPWVLWRVARCFTGL